MALDRGSECIDCGGVVQKGLVAGGACGVVNTAAKHLVEVQVLARVRTGMQPVFGGQVEVAGGADVDRTGTDFSGDVDAAFHVGEVKRTVGVGNLAAHIQVLRAAGRCNRTQAAVDAIGLFGEGVLGDADHALTARAGLAERFFVEIGGARIQGHQSAIDRLHAVGIADANVVDFQSKGGGVGDGDIGLAMGQQAAIGKGQVHAIARTAIGRNIDQAWRGLDGGQAQKQLVKLAARHHGCAAIGLVGQAHFFELRINRIDQGLVARNGFGVAGVAGHPAHNLGAVVKQLVRHVGIDQGRQLHVFGFEDVKLVAQFTGQLLALVAGLNLHLQPACAGVEAFSGGVDGEARTRALEPASIA